MTARKTTCRWQLSVRGLLLVLLVSSAWIGLVAERADRQRRARRALLEMDISVHFDMSRGGEMDPVILRRALYFITQNGASPPPLAPPTARDRLLGRDLYESAVAVTVGSFDQEHLRRALPHIKRLPYLKCVFVMTGSCGNGLGEYRAAVALLEKELPGIEIRPYSLPVVG